MKLTLKVPPPIKKRVEELESELEKLEKELDVCDANETDTKDVLNRTTPVLLEYGMFTNSLEIYLTYVRLL